MHLGKGGILPGDASVTYFKFHPAMLLIVGPLLGLAYVIFLPVIAVAMVVNLLAAALAGILIPLTLYRMGFDPAVASTVFVTTVTDVVGFFSFLGLATLWLM